MFWAYLTMILLIVVGLLLMIVILLQRGRGGGLAGAFGGAGGQSAFGTRAGDVFTKITAVMAIIWVLIAAGSSFVLQSAQSPVADLFEEEKPKVTGPEIPDQNDASKKQEPNKEDPKKEAPATEEPKKENPATEDPKKPEPDAGNPDVPADTKKPEPPPETDAKGGPALGPAPGNGTPATDKDDPKAPEPDTSTATPPAENN